jgi:hypothetical protein
MEITSDAEMANDRTIFDAPGWSRSHIHNRTFSNGR